MEIHELSSRIEMGMTRFDYELYKTDVLESGEPVHVHIARLLHQGRVEWRSENLVWNSVHLPIPMLTYQQMLNLKDGDILVLMPGVMGCNKAVNNPRLAVFEKVDENGTICCYGKVTLNPVFAAGFVAHLGNISDPEHKFANEELVEKI